MSPETKKLYRSRTERMISGVCGGIGEYFHIDATVVRVGFVLLLLVTGFFPMLIFYLIMLVLVPDEPIPSKTVVSTEISEPNQGE